MPHHKTLLFYSTAGCHLCENAKALIRPLLQTHRFTLREIDIADSDALMEAYGVRIPVVAREDLEGDLGWPFSDSQLNEFLQR